VVLQPEIKHLVGLGLIHQVAHKLPAPFLVTPVIVLLTQTVQPSVEFEVTYARDTLLDEIDRGISQAMSVERGEDNGGKERGKERPTGILAVLLIYSHL
jgi:hypothetical protein